MIPEKCMSAPVEVKEGTSYISPSGLYRLTIKPDGDDLFFFATGTRKEEKLFPAAGCVNFPSLRSKLIWTRDYPAHFYDIDNHPTCSAYLGS